jgi:hypothetical protein
MEIILYFIYYLIVLLIILMIDVRDCYTFSTQNFAQTGHVHFSIRKHARVSVFVNPCATIHVFANHIIA